MSFGSNLIWNRFIGSYFQGGIDVNGNIKCQPTYKITADTIEGNSEAITTASALTVNNT